MHIVPVQPSMVGRKETFTGQVYIDQITTEDVSSRIRVTAVRFSPRARTAWHSHAARQSLHVTEGVGRAQARGGEVITIRPGDTIYTPPGEWHWHGAAPDNFMTQLAMLEAPEHGAEVEWGRPRHERGVRDPWGVERPTSGGETPYLANCSASQVQRIIGPR